MALIAPMAPMAPMALIALMAPMAPIRSPLDRWQAHAGDASVEVQCVGIGHPRDVVERALELAVDRRFVQVVLTAHQREERTTISIVWV